MRTSNPPGKSRLASGRLLGVIVLTTITVEVCSHILLHDRLRTQAYEVPTLEQVRTLATLLTFEIEVADVSVSRVDGLLGGLDVAMLLRGQAQLGVDLNNAELVEIEPQTRTATLRLSSPKIINATIDHARTRIAVIRYDGLWQLNPQTQPLQQLLEDALADAQRRLTEAGAHAEYVERARSQAEQVIDAWAATLGWRIAVLWE